MAWYAKVSTDGTTVLERKFLDNPVLVPRAQAEAIGKPFWLPLILRGDMPAYNPLTENVPQKTEVIGATNVIQGWDAPTSKTAQEIDDMKTTRATSSANDLLAKLVKRLMATQFALINDVRSRHAQAPLTVNQYLSFFDSSADDISDAEFIAKVKEFVE